MSLFSDLMGKIFGHATSATPAAAVQTPTSTATGTPAPTTSAPTSAGLASMAAPASVDVGAILDGLAAKSSESLDWKRSIVDLMKLVGMDSSLTARKQLAAELNYTGDTNDSAAMNVWLHQAVLQKLAQNGGKIPANLLHS